MRASSGPWTAAALALACAWLAACASLPAAPALPPMTPAPARVAAASGALRIADGAALRVERPGDRRTAEILAELTARAGGPKLNVTEAPGRAAIELRRGEVPEPEGYRLEVTPDGARVVAGTDAGLFYGAMTLWQLMTAQPGAATIPAMRIEDAPRFRWRGLMLDSARHYQSPEFIRRLIDGMAAHKLNVLHWHLTDDQAWRLEIKKYPKLTQVGGWRVPAGQGPAADIDPATGKPRLYGGVYTQDEVRALVAYAAERQITMVPEIEMPGHASAATAAYPELAASADAPKQVPADWGVYPNLFNTEDSTFAFLTDVLDEVVALFPSTYIHVGGDEAVKDQWKASPRIQAQMKALGVKDEHALQTWFVQRIGRHLAGKGRRLIGWDEILEGGLPADATVMSWRGIDGAVAAARAGHDTVLSPAPVLYFDNRQTARTDEPPGRGRVVSLAEVYAFDPAPAQLTPEERRHVLGLQGNLWTEHVRTEDRAAHMLFPRGLAIAEIGWAAEGPRNYAAFERRAQAGVARLRRLGLAAAETPFLGAEPAPDPRYRANRQLKLCSEGIALALEDDAPVRGERAVFLTDIMNPCWIWPAAELGGIVALELQVGQLPFNYQIGEDIKKVVAGNNRTPAGELEVRIGGCQAAPAVVVPLGPAASNPAVTTLTAKLPPTSGRQDLCFTFTRPEVDPMWALGGVRLLPGDAR
ncbi:family 20 glycosylhydrolase [Phenylobacterium sp.]|jgi:hexosaminidase|uniref:family 20 glycosylhydrolase n=1 Tax=Phenylobacterium sp. TaxID=1871053 RepID=UPI002F93B6D7